MQKELRVQFNLFKKWLFVALFLLASNPILTDIIIYIAPNKAVKYTMFFVLASLSYYTLHQLLKRYLLLSKRIEQ